MDHKQDFTIADITISFKSGHYKAFRGSWIGDSVWAHFYREDGSIVHVNKDQIEFIESTPLKKEE